MTDPASRPTARAALAVGGVLLAVMAAVAVAAGGPAESPRRFSFGLWGDVPYAQADCSPT